MKVKKIGKQIVKILVILLAMILLFAVATWIMHTVKSKKEIDLLKQNGYYNPVSVGDYSLNVSLK